MDGPGTITWEEFLNNAKSLLEISNEISDGWKLRGDEETPGQAYLFKRMHTFVSSNLSNKLIDESADEHLGNLEETRDPFEAKQTEESPMVVEYHILWSMSYGVPVLFFNAWMSGNKQLFIGSVLDYPGVNPVAVEAVQNLIQQDVGYNELSQAIHPILGTIFLYFHPCMSKELLQSTSKSNNKLISWLSIMAPSALNLKLPLEYLKLTFW